MNERRFTMRTIYMTTENHRRLHSLLAAASRDGRNRDVARDLESELNRARVVPNDELPNDVVTMHSKVRILDMDGREEMMFTLVFPGEAKVEEGKVSVLAPLATAILGYRAGDTLTWKMPDGDRRIKVLEILYQPEAQRSANGS